MTSFINKKISYTDDIDDVALSCVMAITCPLGHFYPDKSYGNSIKYGTDVKELLASARQAVSKIDGVYIKDATVSDDEIDFTLLINDDIRSVSIELEKNI